MAREYPPSSDEVRLWQLSGGDDNNRITPWTSENWIELDHLQNQIFRNSPLAQRSDANVTAQTVSGILHGVNSQVPA